MFEEAVSDTSTDVTVLSKVLIKVVVSDFTRLLESVPRFVDSGIDIAVNNFRFEVVLVKDTLGNGIGFEALPNCILKSSDFSGNELAKLASVKAIPVLSSDNLLSDKESLITECKKLLSIDEVDKAWQLVLMLESILIEK